MKKTLILFSTFLIVGSLVFLCLSCSSSDSGDDSSNTPAGVRQATLNQETVDDAVSFIEGNVSACAMDVPAQASSAVFRESLKIVKEAANQVSARQSDAAKRKAAAEGEDDLPMTIPGNCPGEEGSIVIDGTTNEITGVFTGSITINSFCEEISDGSETIKGTMNGSLQLSMQFDTATNALKSISVSTNPGGVSVDTADVSATISLQGLQINASESEGQTDITVTMGNLTVSNIESGVVTQTVQISNLSVQVVATDAQTTVNGSMQYVDSEEGSISVNLSDLIISGDNDEVASGTLTLSGADNTKVQISPGGNNTFLIEADTNGDGVYDYQPGTMDCSSLDTSEIGNQLQ